MGPPDNECVQLAPLKPAIVNHTNYNNNNNNDNNNPVAGSSFHNPNANHPSTSSLFEYPLLSKRAASSKKLLSQTVQYKNEDFSLPFVARLSGGPPPSRKREEREAMQNLRKRVAPHHLVRPRSFSPNEKTEPEPEKTPEKERSTSDKPGLLQRILFSRPLSIVVELNEVRTAWQDSDFITECLCWHNVYRQRHGAPSLTMSPELCGYAQTWANHLAHTNKFSYRNDREIGQNLFQRPVSDLQADVTGQEVSSYWYAAVRQYDYFKEPDILHANVNAGHFTQMVWVATRFFGVGKARSRVGKVIVVAHYSPPGNVSGAFELNVLPPIPDYNVPGPFPYDIQPHHIMTNHHKDPSDSMASTQNSNH